MHPNDTTNDAPKLCECGCGQPAPIAKTTDPKRGYVKGQPTRFIVGHNYKGYKERKPRRVAPLEERFLQRVNQDGPNGCWLWTGNTQPTGYGSIWEKGKSVYAHRVSYELYNGPIPAGMFICHHCDNPRCVNPKHLFAGTQAENMQDMKYKGHARHPRPDSQGERHPMAILTVSQVLEIRDLKEQGNSTREISLAYGVSKACIKDIIGRRSWKHV
jgi:hypothetical protein